MYWLNQIGRSGDKIALCRINGIKRRNGVGWTQAYACVKARIAMAFGAVEAHLGSVSPFIRGGCTRRRVEGNESGGFVGILNYQENGQYKTRRRRALGHGRLCRCKNAGYVMYPTKEVDTRSK